MSITSPDTSQIVRYLLGRLPENEQSRFEERLLENEDLFEMLEETESELIDEYLDGTLSADDRRRFEFYFLDRPERRTRVEFARALHEAAAERKRERFSQAAKAGSERGASPDTAAWWRRWAGSWFEWPRLMMLAACCLIIVSGGLLWALVINSRLRQQIQGERASAQQQAAAQLATAESQLSNERALRQQLEAALGRLDSGQFDSGSKGSGQSAIVSFVLSSFFVPVRGGEGQAKPPPQQLLIPAAVKRVSLSFPVQAQGADFTGYQVSLRRADDPNQVEIWGSSGLPPVSAPGRHIRIRVPASLLTTGDYRLKLSGAFSDGNTESIGEYRFTVVRGG